MPMRRKTSKVVRKRKAAYRRKRNYRRRRANPNNTGNFIGFPTNKVVKMRYVSSTSLALNVTSANRFFIRANGIHDPEVITGGHQPMGHDQWSAFYNHYVVLGSKITCKFASAGTAAVPVICAVMLTDDTTVSSDVMTEVERGKAHYGLMTPTINSSTMIVSNTFSAKKFFNVKDVKDNLDRLGAPFGFDPSEEATFEVAVQTWDNQPNANTAVQCVFTIEYIVLMSEPKSILSS